MCENIWSSINLTAKLQPPVAIWMEISHLFRWRLHSRREVVAAAANRNKIAHFPIQFSQSCMCSDSSHFAYVITTATSFKASNNREFCFFMEHEGAFVQPQERESCFQWANHIPATHPAVERGINMKGLKGM